ncbi:MAG: DNA topoisomerase 3 [Spirochaetales bacterium]|nr:DNA topoisomerase 3 [Spirochaetales bacterium]
MKQLVLAEKPSVGRELARVLGCDRRSEGFIEGPEYIITWALGHLVGLAEPAAYSPSYRRWSLKDLPMLPSTLKLEVIDRTKNQFRIIKSLVDREEIASLIIATDAGREGELVARWIIEEAGYEGPIRRLWISSQTEEAIRTGFATLKDGGLYENLYRAAFSRAAADWYVGMNVTRALTCHYDAKLSAGRVQTPILALMVDREDEIEGFDGRFYWTLNARFGPISATLWPTDETSRIETDELAGEYRARIVGKTGTVGEVYRDGKTIPSPLAYDLTALQKDANILLDFSAKETLDILQGLYERHKVVTYPRTDSRYITSDILPTLDRRIEALANTVLAPVARRYLTEGYAFDEGRLVQDAKVTDHHAIIPTETRVDPSRLSKKESDLFNLIALRFLEVLAPAYRYESILTTIESEGLVFKNRTTRPLDLGWRTVALQSGLKSAEFVDEEEYVKEDVAVGQCLSVLDAVVRRFTTPAPLRYTEATLLSAMENAGRLVDDPLLKKQMGGGLGTPATRADIIEKLLQNAYIEREGKNLVPTPKGRELIRLVPPSLKSAALTGEWELRLSNIAEGIEEVEPFLSDIKESARSLVEEVKRSGEVFAPRFPGSKTCPHCSSVMMKVTDPIGQAHFICQRLSCSYEEKEIRKRVFVEPEKKEPSAPRKKVVVVKAPADPGAVKKRVVVKKKAPDELPYRWETTIEVVRPSKLQRREVPRQHAFTERVTSGSSFADLVRASEERKKRRR